MDRAPWQNPKILITLLAIFLSGAAAGALTMRLSLSRERHPPVWREGGREVSLQRFSKELNLSQAQEREMETVLDDFMMYYQTLQAQMDDVRATGKQRIMKILKDDQKQRFEKILGGLQTKQIH